MAGTTPRSCPRTARWCGGGCCCCCCCCCLLLLLIMAVVVVEALLLTPPHPPLQMTWPVSKVGPGLGCWPATCGNATCKAAKNCPLCWSTTAASGKQRMERIMQDGVPEVVCAVPCALCCVPCAPALCTLPAARSPSLC